MQKNKDTQSNTTEITTNNTAATHLAININNQEIINTM